MANLAFDLAVGRRHLVSIVDRDAVILRLADTLICALGADAVSTEDSPVALVGGLCEGGEVGKASIWTTSAPATAERATLTNGLASRYLDFNDTYLSVEAIHPSDVIAPLVALAEASESSWERLIDAVGVGYEFLCRACDVIDLRAAGWDGVTLAPLATVLGGSWILEMDDATTALALNIAALDAASLLAGRLGQLSHWKALAFPHGACKGLRALRLAQAGVSGPEDAFGGRGGFFEQVSGPFKLPDDPNGRIGKTMLKRFPSQIFTQAPIELALRLREQKGFELDLIDSIEVRSFAYAVESAGQDAEKWHPRTRETADHSIPFCVAAALTLGSLPASAFEDLLDDVTVNSLMARTNVIEDKEATARYPGSMRAELHLSLRSGLDLREECDGPSPLTASDLMQKATELIPHGLPTHWPWRLSGDQPASPLTTVSSIPYPVSNG